MFETDRPPELSRNASTITEAAGTTRNSPTKAKNGATPATDSRRRATWPPAALTRDSAEAFGSGATAD